MGQKKNDRESAIRNLEDAISAAKLTGADFNSACKGSGLFNADGVEVDLNELIAEQTRLYRKS